MKKEKKNLSRYGVQRHQITLDESVIVYGESTYARMGGREDGKDGLGMFDFEGGPCFVVGDKINNKTIVSITQVVAGTRGVPEKSCAVELHYRR